MYVYINICVCVLVEDTEIKTVCRVCAMRMSVSFACSPFVSRVGFLFFRTERFG